MVFVTADQYTCFFPKVDPIDIQDISWCVDHWRQRPYLPKPRGLSPESPSFARKITLYTFAEQPLKEELKLLGRIVYLRCDN